MAEIKVYGAGWCPMTIRTVDYLKKLGMEFKYIDVEQDEQASAWVKQQNHGLEKKPTVDIDGKILSEPSNDELQAALDLSKAA